MVKSIVIRWKAKFVALAMLLLSSTVQAQMGMGGMGGKKEDKGKVIKKDLPLIACDVCNEVVAASYANVEDKREKAPYKKIDELDVSEVLDGVCLAKNKYGEWMRQLDIVEKPDRTLSLERPGGVGKCQSECKTIAKSCEMLLDEEIDRDDLSAMLWKGKHDIKSLQKKVCSSLSNRCGKKPKTMNEKRNRKDYTFKPMEQKELDMEQMMANMEAMGMGGMSMHSRDEMMDMYGGGDMGMDPYGGMMDGYGDPYGDMMDMPGTGMGSSPPSDADFEL